MSASVNGKKQCVTCSKSGGVMICDGCRQPFCGKHSVEHRQELTNQLDGLMQEHDLIQQELGQSFINCSLLKQINEWEKESIAKIQVTAKAARTDLVGILDESKKRISKACHDIAVNLRSSREADDFSENDLDRWMEQLKELKLEVISPPSVKFVEDEQSAIPLIRVKNSEFAKKMPVKIKELYDLTDSAVSIAQERFSQVFGAVVLEKEGFFAKHVGNNYEYGSILGKRLYSHGQQVVRFAIKFNRNSYNIYFGCISSRAMGITINHGSPFAVGWFGCNQIYQHGTMKGNYEETGYDSTQIRTNDILRLTFDCEEQQIELCHERINKTYTLSVNLDKSPFPWQLFIVLTQTDDCVTILPNV